MSQAKIKYHFAHKNTIPDCNPETYLHKLAKLKIKEKFDSGLPFEISFCQTFRIHFGLSQTNSTNTLIAPCAPNTKACSMSAVLEGPETKKPKP